MAAMEDRTDRLVREPRSGDDFNATVCSFYLQTLSTSCKGAGSLFPCVGDAARNPAAAAKREI